MAKVFAITWRLGCRNMALPISSTCRAVFARLDVLKSKEMKIPSPESRSESEREREKLLRAAGRELLGDKGLNCIACHNFNGKAAQVNQGIDLLTTLSATSAWVVQ